MKTTSLWSIAATSALALLATSCAQETIETKNSDNELTYGVSTGRQTIVRAAEVAVADLETGFDVDVRYTVSGSAFATYTVWNNGAWVYGDGADAVTVYHPELGLSHYATYPTQTYTSIDGVSAAFDYTVGGVEEQEDLVAIATTTTSASASAATANMVFKHLLSQVNFEVTVPDDENLTVSLTNLSVNGVKNEGAFTLTSSNGSVALSASGSASYAYTIEGENGSLMLMPQEFAEGDAATNFSFDYTITDSNSVVVKSGTGVTKAFGDLKFGAGEEAKAEWAMGHKYIYRISFADPVKIGYDVDVEGWEDGGSVIVNQ